jgi:hypothetical protein
VVEILDDADHIVIPQGTSATMLQLKWFPYQKWPGFCQQISACHAKFFIPDKDQNFTPAVTCSMTLT